MVLASNPRARRDYEILERLEAGLKLTGFEVKAVRSGRAELRGARVIVRGGEAYLVGAKIQPYQPKNLPVGFLPERTIKLLLTKTEISRLGGLAKQKGLTIIPLAVYDQGNRLKAEIAVARGRKKYDKRQLIRKREAEREIQRTLKGKYRAG